MIGPSSTNQTAPTGFRIDVVQQPLQRKGASPNQIGRIFDALWGTGSVWNTILSPHGQRP